MSNRSLLALFAFPILVAGTAALAQEDNKTFPGAMCQPSAEGAESTTMFVRDEVTGGIFNEVGPVGVLFCPIVRDLTRANSFESARIVVARVTTEPPPPRPFVEVECDIVSNTQFGEAARGLANLPPPRQLDTRRVVVGDEVIQTLDVGTLAFQLGGGPRQRIPSAAFGHYFFLCFLDAGEGVISYTIKEN